MANKTMNDNNSNYSTNDMIKQFWVPSSVSVNRHHQTIIGYSCYCDLCKKKSSSGDGGIAFETPEDVLVHRDMKAFMCPAGCGYHVCEEFSSIIRHITYFHEEILEQLKKEGLNLEGGKKKWIYRDEEKYTYTINNPLPTAMTQGSPLENAIAVMTRNGDLKPPPRVMTPKKQEGTVTKTWSKIEKPVSVSLGTSSTTDDMEATTQQKLAKKLPQGKKWKTLYTLSSFPLAASQKAQQEVSQEQQEVPQSQDQQSQQEVPQPQDQQSHQEVPQPQELHQEPHQEPHQELHQEPQSHAPQRKELPYERPVHYAQVDMHKEKQCTFGKGCRVKDKPFSCALNHDGKGNIIKTGTELTLDVLCMFERPPFMRCGDGKCTKIHLQGRADIIAEKKSAFYKDAPPQVFNTNSKPKLSPEEQEKQTAKQLAYKAAYQATKDAKAQLKREAQDDTEFEGTRVQFQEMQSADAVAAQQDDNEMNDDDLTNPLVLLARAKLSAFLPTATSE